MEKLTRTVVASDEHGRPQTIYEFTEFKVEFDLAGRKLLIPGLKSLRLANGDSVTRLNRGEYFVVSTATILRSTAPDAP